MMNKGAALCEAFGILQAPHNRSRWIDMHATMHFAAAAPSCAFCQEYSIEQGAGSDLSLWMRFFFWLARSLCWMHLVLVLRSMKSAASYM